MFALAEGAPIRASAKSAGYYVAYMDWLFVKVQSGFFDGAVPIDDTALLADIADARAVFEQIESETVPEPSSTLQICIGLAVLLGLRARRS